jgi:acyl-CoA dehydrogenase
LNGVKWPVADGGIADIAIVAARDETDAIALFLVETKSVARKTLRTVDPTRDQARFDCNDTPAEKLSAASGWATVQRLLDRAAILFAFEQVGGADASCRWHAITRWNVSRSAARSDRSRPSSTS